MNEYEQALKERYADRLLKIKFRNNQYLPHNKNNLLMSHKKLNKSKSQFLKLSKKVKANRKNIKSVKKALIKPKPIDYYEEGKYLYDRQIEKIKKLFLNNLETKNDILEEKLKVMEKKMVKVPLYILNGMKNKKKISIKEENIDEQEQEQEDMEEQSNEREESDHNNDYNKFNGNKSSEDQQYDESAYEKSYIRKKDHYKRKKNYGYDYDN